MLRGNPFLVREQQLWRRSRHRSLGRVATLLLVLIALCAAFRLPTWTAERILAATMLTWALMAAAWTFWRGAASCPRDDETGMLPLVSVTPMSPWKQAVGRWLATLLPVSEVLLLGFLFLAPLTVLEVRYGHPRWPVPWLHASALRFVLIVWMGAWFWSTAVAALSLMGSATSATRLRGIVNANVPTYLAYVAWYMVAADDLIDLEFWVTGGTWQSTWTIVACKLLLSGCLCLAIGLVGTSLLLRWRERIRAWADSHLPLFAGCRSSGKVPIPRPWRQCFLHLDVGPVPREACTAAILFIALAPAIISFLLDDPMHCPREVLLAAACVVSFLGFGQAIALAYVAVGAERDAGTWDLLVSTGVRPATLLTRWLATATRGLHADWSWTLPAWAVTAVITLDAAVLPLALLQPAAIVTGFLLGVHSGAQPSRSAHAYAAAAILLTFIAPWISLHAWILAGIDLDAAASYFSTLAHLDPASLTPTVALAWALCIALLYRICHTSLDRLLRGDERGDSLR